ncbi:GAF domain-containing protein [Arthrobacter sp. NPDC057013]|uniref:GAF domain-containing protein n=1 Tax=Arthrobacter sp. NPDC057013 TaxID=3345999 RepID=UPI003632E4F5
MRVRPDRLAEYLQGWLQALADIGAAVNRGTSLRELLDQIARSTCQLMSCDFCAVTIPDDSSHVLVIEGSFGLSPDYIRYVNDSHPIRLDGVHEPTPTAQAFTLGIPVQVSDIGSDPTLAPYQAAAKEAGLTSMISVPLNSADAVLGTLNCYSRSLRHFTKEEESLLIMVADQAAVAVTTSRLRSVEAQRIASLNNLEEQYELQKQAESAQERLTALILNGGGMHEIGEALTEILNRPVAVCETNGIVLYSSRRSGTALPTSILTAAAPTPSAPGGRSGLLNGVRLPVPEGTLQVVCAPVMIRGETVAWLWTSGPISELRPLERQTLERAVSPLALELFRTRAVPEYAWQTSGQLLAEILTGKGRSRSGLLTRAADSGHDLTCPQALLCVDIAPDREQEQFPYWLSAAFTEIAAHLSPMPILGIHNGYIAGLWPLQEKKTADLRNVVERLRQAADDETSAVRYAAIVGPLADVTESAEAFATARGALRLAGFRGSPSRTLLLIDQGLLKLLLQNANISALSQYADQVLKPLRAHDVSHHTLLLPTISALIHHDLDVEAAAAVCRLEKSIFEQNVQLAENVLDLKASRIADLMKMSLAIEVQDIFGGSIS